MYEAARSGVEIEMVIRGICCMLTENKKFKEPVQAISIVDEYLEHARIMVFHGECNPPDALAGRRNRRFRFIRPARWITSFWKA